MALQSLLQTFMQEHAKLPQFQMSNFGGFEANAETWAGTVSPSSDLRYEEHEYTLGNSTQKNLTGLMQD